jgi:hypothetical protein
MLFAAASQSQRGLSGLRRFMGNQERLWRHYATRDLQVFCCLGKHLDVLRPDVQSKLVPLIEDILISQQDGSY